MARIGTLAEFKALFEVCDVTGCWLPIGQDSRKYPKKLRLLHVGKRVTIGQAAYILTEHKEPPAGMIMACTCDSEHCGNPKHRKLFKRGEHQERGTKRSMAVRARISKAMRSMSSVGMTLELAEEIRRSEEPLEAAASRLGVSRSLVQKIRAGKAWMPLVHGASVFSLAGR